MSKRCDLMGFGLIRGNKVSHSKVKTKRVFLPNLINKSFCSKYLGDDISFKINNRTLRTIDKHGGLDNFFIKIKKRKLTTMGLKIRKLIFKKMTMLDIKNLSTQQ